MISFIVPVYNSEKWIESCIKSVIRQSYNKIELLLINDGSTDNSKEICEYYENIDPRVRLINKRNGGVSSARNIGLENARGDYIAFLDSDDCLDENFCDVLLTLIKEYSTDVAICGFNIETSPGVYHLYYEGDCEITFEKQSLLLNLVCNNYYTCSACGVLFKRSILEGLRFNEKYKHYEDLDFVFRVFTNVNKGRFTSRGLYYYNNVEGSASKSIFNADMMSIIDVSEYIYNYFLINNKECYGTALKEFVRNNIMCATNAAKSNYNDCEAIKRIRNNIKQLLINYLLSDASKGYKLYSIVISISWGAFKHIIKLRSIFSHIMNCII